MKIDVEGFEKNVLVELQRTLERDRPVVLMELLTEGNAQVSFESEDELRSVFPAEYQFFQFGEYDVYSGEYSLEPLAFDKRANFSPNPLEVYPRNIVAFPLEKWNLPVN